MERILIIFSLIVFSWTGISAQTETAQINLKIGEIKKAEGNMIISVFDNEDDWLEKSVKDYLVPVKSKGTLTYTIKNLKTGKYALAFIHDIDENGELNSSIFGPPSEPYGFSNNARGFMAPASFEDATFEIKSGETLDFNIKLE